MFYQLALNQALGHHHRPLVVHHHILQKLLIQRIALQGFQGTHHGLIGLGAGLVGIPGLQPCFHLAHFPALGINNRLGKLPHFRPLGAIAHELGRVDRLLVVRNHVTNELKLAAHLHRVHMMRHAAGRVPTGRTKGGASLGGGGGAWGRCGGLLGPPLAKSPTPDRGGAGDREGQSREPWALFTSPFH